MKSLPVLPSDLVARRESSKLDPAGHPDSAACDAKAWLQANSERMRRQVLGMATIVPAEHLERVNRMNAEKLFGVPAKSFGTIDGALTWMAETVLRPNDIVADLVAIRTILSGTSSGGCPPLWPSAMPDSSQS
jgi:hypothetical protein